jgi:tRNA (guanine37-N1)-methyltransferase
MRIDILTLFPEAFDSFLAHSIIKRAQAAGKAVIQTVDIRKYTHDKHRTADDRPFGGGPGMVLKAEPIFEAYKALYGGLKKKRGGSTKKRGLRFVYLTPSGRRFDQALAQEFAKEKHLAFLCGHYEGVDQRVIDELVTDEVSIGDYVLTQGEVPAMAVIDSTVRLLPGVLGNEGSKEFESFTGNLLEYPHYTRPAVCRGLKVPEVLLSGDHKKIAEWRHEQALLRTRKKRPDLLKKKRVLRSR